MATTHNLVETIRETGLVEPDRLPDLSLLAEIFPDPRELGREILNRGWLTPFQVNQLLQGKGKGLRLGGYVLLERIGVGGMGEVFKAIHRKLRRAAAVKVITAGRLAHPAAIQRFRREAEAAARLSHPHIVTVFDFGSEGDTYFLAMEYIDGIDLAQLVHRTGPLPVPIACDTIRQAALGLQHAHEQGMVHRDIKPANLLLCPRGGYSHLPQPTTFAHFAGGIVKILDMGLVRLPPDRVEATALALTQQGILIGTMDYLAPEQARNAHRVDHRADIYSLGCTLYHLLSGRFPFPGSTLLDKLLSHQHDEPTPIRAQRNDMPPELELLLTRMMAKDRDQRIQTAAEVAHELEPFLGGEASPGFIGDNPSPMDLALTRVVTDPEIVAFAFPATVETPSRTVARKRRRARPKRRWLVGVIGLLILLLLGIAMVRKVIDKGEPNPKRVPKSRTK